MARLSAWHRLSGVGKWTNCMPDWSGASIVINKDVSRKIYNGQLSVVSFVIEVCQAFVDGAKKRSCPCDNFFLAIWLDGPALGKPWMVLGDKKNYRKYVQRHD